jgi:hypothetical protein
MIIREASLCLRFYTADGWKRYDVAELLENVPKGVVPVHIICPRWFDNHEKDKEYGGYEYKTSTQHLDCDYYTVYHPDVSFDEEKLKQHTIIPFGSVVANIA